MSSLWTPSGEHPVDREKQGQTPPQPTLGPPADGGEGDGSPRIEDLPPEQRAQVEAMAQQMQEAQARMLQAPPEAVVGQYVLQLYDVAALYLSQEPPRIDDARLAIDAFKAVVETLGARLGEAENPLRQNLHQLQLAFVEVSNKSADPT